MDHLIDSLKKLALNYGRLALVEAGLPLLMQQFEEMKLKAEREAQKFAVKAVLVSIALLFLFITLIFLFVGIFFLLVDTTGSVSSAAFFTTIASLVVTLIMALIVGIWK